MGWYSAKFQRALDIFADEFPELKTDQDARDTLTALIAITSDGQKVGPNFAQAADIYANFRETGAFTTTRGHQRQESILGNLERIQAMYEQLGAKGMRDFLMQEATLLGADYFDDTELDGFTETTDKMKETMEGMKVLQESQVKLIQQKLAQAGIRNKELAVVVLFSRMVLPVLMGLIGVVLIYKSSSVPNLAQGALTMLGAYVVLAWSTALGVPLWVAIPLDVLLALGMMKLAAFGEMKEGVKKQFAIFGNKHTWSLTALYIVTFGSFIGFSMALPLAITVIFGFQHIPDANGVMQHTLKNPNAPSALTYAWMGPFIGAAIRPVGGWISDKVGGSIVTQIISVVMVARSYCAQSMPKPRWPGLPSLRRHWPMPDRACWWM